MELNETVIVSAVRTPIGSFQGALSGVSATELGSVVIAEALRRAHLGKNNVDEVIMGNVLSAGLGQAPARQAALGAGLSRAVPCLTINKVCGSGLKAVMLGAQAIRLGEAQVVVAGGMESMSQAPYLLSKAREGYRMGHGVLVDSMIKDGLWDVYNDFHMGEAAELCAEKFQISRKEQDEFAATSYRRAQAAQRDGKFAGEMVAVPTTGRDRKTVLVNADEEPGKFDVEKMVALRPAFRKDGAVTAGNASSVSDGAAALVLMSRQKASELGIRPFAESKVEQRRARAGMVYSCAGSGDSTLLKQLGADKSDIDLFEINEAFAAASIAINRELNLDPNKVNVRGGAVALGHPIGASGARILTTLVHALIDLGKRRGVAALCIGGGEAVALMVERVD